MSDTSDTGTIRIRHFQKCIREDQPSEEQQGDRPPLSVFIGNFMFENDGVLIPSGESNKTFLHALLKYHQEKGPNSLGAGMGYSAGRACIDVPAGWDPDEMARNMPSQCGTGYAYALLPKAVARKVTERKTDPSVLWHIDNVADTVSPESRILILDNNGAFEKGRKEGADGFIRWVQEYANKSRARIAAIWKEEGYERVALTAEDVYELAREVEDVFKGDIEVGVYKAPFFISYMQQIGKNTPEVEMAP